MNLDLHAIMMHLFGISSSEENTNCIANTSHTSRAVQLDAGYKITRDYNISLRGKRQAKQMKPLK